MRIPIGFLFLFLSCIHVSALMIIVKREPDGRIVISDSTPNPLQRRLNLLKERKIPPVPDDKSMNASFLQKIRRLCIKYGFREDMVVAVARAESSFNPFAVSRKGAMGIMQLMHGTAKSYGVNNPFNVDQNLEAGIKHLQYLHNKYHEDIPLTLAAYNAGEEAVEKYKGVPPYPETRRYIRKVVGFMGMPYLYPSTRLKTRIYRYVNEEGKIVITDTRPSPSRNLSQPEIFD